MKPLHRLAADVALRAALLVLRAYDKRAELAFYAAFLTLIGIGGTLPPHR